MLAVAVLHVGKDNTKTFIILFLASKVVIEVHR